MPLLDVTAGDRVRSLAFYLPQFHPIPENDAWWGAGFTEWRNVVHARPRFPGHEQPQLPGELGFYDLRLADTREAQSRLAAQHGIDGFCYYHYWFNGRRLLERPFSEVLDSGSPDFPFCLCWANENWTRRWDGKNQDVLMAQHYGVDDDIAHMRSLTPAFTDRRYIRVEGRPLFLVYRASLLPEPTRTTDAWRKVVTDHGVPEPFLVRVESHRAERGDPRRLGFDAAVEFQPRLFHTRRALGGVTRRLAHSARLPVDPVPRDEVRNYHRYVDAVLAEPLPAYRRFPCVAPGWDNSPRRQRGATIFHGSTPDLYAQWVRHAVGVASQISPPLLFVNAWNEWAEGAHLEPCERWGRAFLEAHLSAVTDD